jgi:hypothetical protein
LLLADGRACPVAARRHNPRYLYDRATPSLLPPSRWWRRRLWTRAGAGAGTGTGACKESA